MKFLRNLAKDAILGLVIALLFYVGLQGVADRNQTMTLPAEAEVCTEADTRIADLEAKVAALSREKEALAAQVEEYRAQEKEVCILVLRYEELFLSGIFGDAIVIEKAVQEIAVSRELYDSCQSGEDITAMELHRLLSCGGLSDTRVIVENKYIKT